HGGAESGEVAAAAVAHAGDVPGPLAQRWQSAEGAIVERGAGGVEPRGLQQLDVEGTGLVIELAHRAKTDANGLAEGVAHLLLQGFERHLRHPVAERGVRGQAPGLVRVVLLAPALDALAGLARHHGHQHAPALRRALVRGLILHRWTRLIRAEVSPARRSGRWAGYPSPAAGA